MPATDASARRHKTIGPLASIWRLVRYRLIVPVFRSLHPAEHTARGVAIGVFWGLTPTLGLQTTEILVTWFLCRRVFRRDASLAQALIWVWVNNPLTMVPMFYLFYLTGQLMMGDPTGVAGYSTFVALWDTHIPSVRVLDRTLALVTTLGLPTLVGSAPWAALGAWVSYRWALAVCRRRKASLESPTTIGAL